MNHRHARHVMITVLVVVAAQLAACEGSPETPRHDAAPLTALVIDHASLPGHRHADQLEQLERHYLQARQPGDRLLLGTRPGDGNDEVLAHLDLPDRPLAATRQLRQLRHHLAVSGEDQWVNLELALPLVADRFRRSSGTRCLYLALNPEAAGLPALGDLPEDRLAGSRWTAFLLVPESSNPHAVTLWTEYLYYMGAGRIMTTSLANRLPACR
ncbi:hypothetical protein [Natronospira bacteriovora]|uniref:Lipoprotein n=1 Tax=Natronospira bacteriovora TaxID=3069753 RepID=A0ABU0W4Y6_9GAMM|nr:hypothetical protein [Natronospira sp. AB-CW4]MDQ2069087.1 hypothetical protein [Natronospira sp. AB-CW4]